VRGKQQIFQLNILLSKFLEDVNNSGVLLT